MRTVQINYDLHLDRLYPVVEAYIKQHSWDHLLQSLWLIRTTKTTATVRDELNRLVGTGGKVAVFDVTQVLWATNFDNEATDWLLAAA
jgi:hypothetical protein